MGILKLEGKLRQTGFPNLTVRQISSQCISAKIPYCNPKPKLANIRSEVYINIAEAEMINATERIHQLDLISSNVYP